MATPTARQLQAIAAVANAIEETVAECSTPASNGYVVPIPTGVMYATLMGSLSLQMFQSILRAMVGEGRLVEDGDCVKLGPKSRFAPQREQN